MDPTDATLALFELTLLFVGVVLLWRHYLSPSARANIRLVSPGLSPWQISISDFLFFTLVIVGSGLVASFIAGLVLGRFELPEDTVTIFNGAAFQIGLLIGPALVPLNLRGAPSRVSPVSAAFRSGLATFLIALPVITVANIAWLAFLKLIGLPIAQQDLLRMFSQAESAGLLALMIVLAVGVAPVAEELLFRATFFRYLRTRLPRWIALLVPGTIFAALHVNWLNLDGLASLVPLITLSVVFSIAYERTGRIATVIVAHAIFNLHTIVLLFAGVGA